jgi:hypothetical protein
MKIKVSADKSIKVESDKKQEKPDNASFNDSKTPEQLAKEQGVIPIKSINDLFGFWPEDEDFESFLNEVRSAGH